MRTVQPDRPRRTDDDEEDDSYELAVNDALAYDRTHLANERTFASWLRTGLSIAAGGIAVAHVVGGNGQDALVALGLGGAFVLVGVGCLAYGAAQFIRLSRELTRQSRRPAPVARRSILAITWVLSVLLLAVLWFLWASREHAPVAPIAPGTPAAVTAPRAPA